MVSPPSHSQSISSRSSDSITKEETIPVPAAACVVTLTLPKNIYHAELMVGACVSEVIMNSAPLVPS